MRHSCWSSNSFTRRCFNLLEIQKNSQWCCEASLSPMLRKTLTGLAVVLDGSQATKWCQLPKHTTWHHCEYTYFFSTYSEKRIKHSGYLFIFIIFFLLIYTPTFNSSPEHFSSRTDGRTDGRRRSRDADKLPTPGITHVTMATAALAYYYTEKVRRSRSAYKILTFILHVLLRIFPVIFNLSYK